MFPIRGVISSIYLYSISSGDEVIGTYLTKRKREVASRYLSSSSPYCRLDIDWAEKLPLLPVYKENYRKRGRGIE